MSGYQAGSVIYGLGTVISLQRIALPSIFNQCIFNNLMKQIFSHALLLRYGTPNLDVNAPLSRRDP